MSDAVFSDGKYTFNSEPRVVKGVHETILWFVTGSDISTGMVPSVLPHQEVGEFVDAFLVYYNSSAQSIVSKATRGARKLELYNSEIQLNCTNQPQSCNIACFRIKAKENALNKKFLVHHDSVVHFPMSKRRLLSDDDELQSLKAGTILLDTRQSNMTAYVTLDIQTDRQMDSQAELSEVKDFQEETYRRTCVNLPIRMESWENVCSPRGRKNMSYDCFK
jgi:hypothetical protein